MPAKRARSQSVGPGEAVLLDAMSGGVELPEPQAHRVDLPLHEREHGPSSWKWVGHTCIIHAPLRPDGPNGVITINLDLVTSIQEQYDGRMAIFFERRMVVIRNEMVTAFKDALQALTPTYGPCVVHVE